MPVAPRSHRSECAAEGSLVAEPPFGFAPRSVMRKAIRDEFACSHLQMKGQFLVDFAVDADLPRLPIKAPGMPIYPSVCSRRDSAAEKRAHSAVCAASAFRPRGVIR